MTDKLYYSYNDIHNLIYDLANKIKKSEFKPDYILAVGGGGFIPARMLRAFIDIPILSMTINYYDKNNEITNNPNIIQWIDNMNHMLEDKKILIIDEIDDKRRTLKYIINRLRNDNIKNLGVAVIHNKLKSKEVTIENIPYFFADEIPDKWVVYPWDIQTKLS